MSSTQKQQENFIESDILAMVISAAFGRGNVYSTDNAKQRKCCRECVKKELKSLATQYVDVISGDEHVNNIKKLVKTISNKQEHCLMNGKFRIGTAQKALNLFLKYLWCLGKIKKPPHFPIDRIMLSKIPKYKDKLNWTQLDSIKKYKEIIEEAEKIAGKSKLAEWELREYNKLR